MVDAFTRLINGATPHDRRLQWSLMVTLAIVSFEIVLRNF